MDLVRKLLDRVIVFLDQIPLVDGYDHSLASLVGNAGDLGVLLGDPFLGVDHEDRDIRSLHRADRAHDHIALQVLFDLVLAPEACSINEDVLLAVMLYARVDGVAGRSRDVRDDQPVLSDQPVYNRRFADVGLSDDCDVDRFVLFFLAASLFKPLDDLVKHVADPCAVGR